MELPSLTDMWTKLKTFTIILIALAILRELGLASPEYSGKVTAGPEF